MVGCNVVRPHMVRRKLVLTRTHRANRHRTTHIG
jgi:hypothetical protein